MNLRRASAFTLIELLVVIAIIVILLSILLPSLGRAREQGKMAVCLSNLKALGTAAGMYLSSDSSNDLPWVLPFESEGQKGYRVGLRNYVFSTSSECIWGGAMPNSTEVDFDNARAYFNSVNPASDAGKADVLVVPPRHRPLNPYLFPGVPFDQPHRDWYDSQDEALRIEQEPEVPGVFKCPSDSSASIPRAEGDNPQEIPLETNYANWKIWGTSYTTNWYWPYYYQKAEPGNRPPYDDGGGGRQFGRIIGLYPSETRGLGRELLTGNPRGGWESTFIIFNESLFNYAMEGARPRGVRNAEPRTFTGWHKQLNKHAAAFLDGHADIDTRDTRYVDGPGWNTWPAKPWTGDWKQYELE